MFGVEVGLGLGRSSAPSEVDRVLEKSRLMGVAREIFVIRLVCVEEE